MATSKVKQQEFTPSEIRPGTNVIPGKLNSSIKSPTAAYEYVRGLLLLCTNHSLVWYSIAVYYTVQYIQKQTNTTNEVDLADEGHFIVEVFVEYVIIHQPEELCLVRPLHL